MEEALPHGARDADVEDAADQARVVDAAVVDVEFEGAMVGMAERDAGAEAQVAMVETAEMDVGVVTVRAQRDVHSRG